jgi:hypothetical protein
MQIRCHVNGARCTAKRKKRVIGRFRWKRSERVWTLGRFLFEGPFVRVTDQAFARDACLISKDVALAAHQSGCGVGAENKFELGGLEINSKIR